MQPDLPDPVVPAIVLIELLAQTGGLAAASAGEPDAGTLAMLRVAAIGPFKFPGGARPNQTLEARARDDVRAQGAPDATVGLLREADARYRGQSFELTLSCNEYPRAIATAFHDAHERRYGYAARDEVVELVNVRAIATAALGADEHESSDIAPTPKTGATRGLYLDGAYREVPLYARQALSNDRAIPGPALIEQYDAITYVAPGWQARVCGTELELTR